MPAGLIVAPGFIDAHTHDDRLLLSAPDMAPKVSQGVTTVVTGNCGISLAHRAGTACRAGHAAARPARRRGRVVPVPRPSRAYLAALRDAARRDQRRAAGRAHDVARRDHGRRRPRRADDDEIAADAGDGATKRSRPARSASRPGLVLRAGRGRDHRGSHRGLPAAARVAAASTAPTCATKATGSSSRSRRRSAIGRELGVPVVISHHKVVGTPNHGRSTETLPLIASAMQEQPIGLDCYPYCASSTVLSDDRARRSREGASSPGRSRIPEYAGMRSGRGRAPRWACRGPRPSTRCCRPARSTSRLDEEDVQRILAFERDDDRLGRAPARRRAASAAVGHLPARARPLLARARSSSRSRPRSTR